MPEPNDPRIAWPRATGSPRGDSRPRPPPFPGFRDEIARGSYRPGSYRTFAIFEPKKRIISAAPYRDRVLHHAICNVIEPFFDRTFIHDTYACRKGKGTHAALDRFTRFARRYRFALAGDVRRYFPSIDREILLRFLGRRIADRRLMDLLRVIVESPADGAGQGLPIGNLTSQLFANIYLDGWDHRVLEDLRAPGYIRYCDDFVVFGDEKAELRRILGAAREHLASLALDLHEKKCLIHRTRDGVKFLGFKVFPDHRLVLPRAWRRARRRLRALQDAYAAGDIGADTIRASIVSWIGHLRHGDTWRRRGQMLAAFAFSR